MVFRARALDMAALDDFVSRLLACLAGDPYARFRELFGGSELNLRNGQGDGEARG